MNDRETTVAELREAMARFVALRGWGKFHRPKNLAMSLAIEAGELMEHFQWLAHDEVDAALDDAGVRGEVADEMADVLAYLLSLANAAEVDLSAAFEAKMARNETKYPPDEVFGLYKRPDA